MKKERKKSKKSAKNRQHKDCAKNEGEKGKTTTQLIERYHKVRNCVGQQKMKAVRLFRWNSKSGQGESKKQNTSGKIKFRCEKLSDNNKQGCKTTGHARRIIQTLFYRSKTETRKAHKVKSWSGHTPKKLNGIVSDFKFSTCQSNSTWKNNKIT